MGRRLFPAVLLFAGTTTMASRVHAAEADFRLDNEAWNGLSQFSQLAKRIGTPIEEEGKLDWSVIGLDQALFILYPTSNLDQNELLKFLAAGGTVVIADDHGTSQELLDALGISRRPGSDILPTYRLNKNPNLPLAVPDAQQSELGVGVTYLVTNHPSYFRSRLPASFHFGRKDQQLVVEGTYRTGRFIAIADPSIFLNNMMQYPGNHRFARNLLTDLANGTKGIHFFSHQINATGQSPSRSNAKSRNLSKKFNDYVSRISDFALTGPAMKAVAVFLGTLVMLFFLARIPRPRLAMDGHWLDAAAQRATPAGSTDLQSPGQAAAVLREEVEEILMQKLEISDPVSTVDIHWLKTRVNQRLGKAAADKTLRLLSAFRNIPYLTMDTHPFEGATPTEHDLKQLYNLSAEVLRQFESDALPPEV